MMTVEQLIAELRKWPGYSEATINIRSKIYAIGEVSGVGGAHISGRDSVVVIRPTPEQAPSARR